MRAPFLLFAALAACSYPQSQTEQGQQPGQIYFPAAPAGARVIVDGRDAGAASAYDGRTTLAIAPGTHRIVLDAGGGPILDKQYYVNAGTKVAVQ